jgi:hypothetical protein
MAEHESAQLEDSDTEPQVAEHVGGHEAPDGAPLHPLIDLSRDPTPGEPDHARPDED